MIIKKQKNNEEKPVCAVYISAIPQKLQIQPVVPKKREKEIRLAKSEKVKREKFWAWKTLAYALFEKFHCPIAKLRLKKTRSGKWVSKRGYFSISHSNGVVAVALSNFEVGVDIEGIDPFMKKIAEEKDFLRLKDKILAQGERIEGREELLSAWTKKESLYKKNGTGGFVPRKILPKEVSVFEVEIDGKRYCISLAGEGRKDLKFLYYDGEEERALIAIQKEK